jgi:hypothetical protein
MLSITILGQPADQKLSLDKWTYIQVDSTRGKFGDWDKPAWMKYFGLYMKDGTGDGFKDILSGRYFYRNPGADISKKWIRTDLGANVDGMLMVKVDRDKFADVIATKLPDVFWYEAEDIEGSKWKALKIGELKETGHVNGQGYALGQLEPGAKPEVILSCGDGIYYFVIPADPEKETWKKVLISSEVSDEGFAVGDINNDGYQDIVMSKIIESDEKEVPGTKNTKWNNNMVIWFKNPGNGSAQWKGFETGKATNADRIESVDMNADGRTDIIWTEERYPGSVPNSFLVWLEQPADPEKGKWKRHEVAKQLSMNNMDVADMDRDGDYDIITCEHQMPWSKEEPKLSHKERVQVWENDGKGNFKPHLVDTGKESHLGAQVADLDNDGDLDIISIAWRDYKFLHVWRNDAIKK